MKVKIDDVICCSNTELYGEGKISGLHCTSNKKSIGKRCAFCDGTYVKKEYWIEDRFLETVVTTSFHGGKNND